MAKKSFGTNFRNGWSSAAGGGSFGERLGHGIRSIPGKASRGFQIAGALAVAVPLAYLFTSSRKSSHHEHAHDDLDMPPLIRATNFRPELAEGPDFDEAFYAGIGGHAAGVRAKRGQREMAPVPAALAETQQGPDISAGAAPSL